MTTAAAWTPAAAHRCDGFESEVIIAEPVITSVSRRYKTPRWPVALLAGLDPDRVKERRLHDAIFRKEWANLFAVWDCCQDLQQE